MAGPDVTVGDDCKIQNNVSLYKGVTLEDGVFCGPSCVFTNVNNPRAEIERKDEFRPTLVRRGATIGANTTIVCGHTIGAYAFIAAGAVVTQNVPDFALMAGVPARRIGWMSRDGERLGPDLVCPRSGRRYREAGPDSIEEIAGRVHVEAVFVDIDKDRGRAEPGDDFGSRGKGKGRDDHRLAGLEPQRHQRQPQSVGAVGAAQHMLGAAELGELPFELGDLRP